MRFSAKLFLVLSLAGFLISEAQAYQEIDVKNGGTIKGKAIMTGETPENRVYHLVLFPNVEMCAHVDTDDEKNRVLDDFKINENGGLQDVVITLENVDAGKPFENKPIQIISQNCKFTPEINVIQQGGAFTLNNIDSVPHNSQVYQSERGKIILNIPIPAEEISHGVVHFQKDYKIFQMICGMHEFMQTWGVRIQNPYYVITGPDGSFNIENVPPGDYVINAWHYLMKTRTGKIHISENSIAEVSFDFNANEVIRPLYETIKSGRIKKDAKAHRKN